ncbi:hypothetical protein NFO65_28390 [Neorhizobium galegae]|uniref:hypothetical protein n=1 Tax=Neorhizobium galegae TaxID=399 RepID=UPI0021013DC1|nr:hypothetical protein [Neorhizobium galegae]MCQ1574641.1 hypothetical protein [Neorhizobium galegae]
MTLSAANATFTRKDRLPPHLQLFALINWQRSRNAAICSQNVREQLEADAMSINGSEKSNKAAAGIQADPDRLARLCCSSINLEDLIMRMPMPALAKSKSFADQAA